MPQWWFRDRANQTQGPFSDDEMRAWFEAGYLSGDLMISKDGKTNFIPLSKWFPNGSTAFLPEQQTAVAPSPQNPAANANLWYFVDKSNKVQGPFSDVHMRQWHMAGYFEPTLQIMNMAIPGAQWQMLRDMFPNIVDAFLVNQAGGGLKTAKSAVKTATDNKSRFEFPGWLPVPPRYKGVKKMYPSERNGSKRKQVNIVDVNGRQVENFEHARARVPS